MLISFKEITSIALILGLITLFTPAQAQQNSLNFISDMRGDVKIKRASQRNYRQAYRGDTLNSSDSLRLGRGAYVEVLCDNSNTWYPKSPGTHKVSIGCPSIGGSVRRSSNRLPTRPIQDPNIPYVISPRNTRILTTKPTLRWNPVEGANSYEVRIQGIGFMWQTEVEGTGVAYGCEKLLQPGAGYELVVNADNGASSLEESSIRFYLLEEKEAGSIRSEVEQLQKRPLSEEGKALALVYLYRRNGLQAEAIEVLADLVAAGNETTAVHLLLADLYQDSDLVFLAQRQYLQALDLAKQEENWEAQAISQVELGAMEEVIDELQLATEFYEEALASYRILGDEEQIRELEQKLIELQKKIEF